MFLNALEKAFGGPYTRSVPTSVGSRFVATGGARYGIVVPTAVTLGLIALVSLLLVIPGKTVSTAALQDTFYHVDWAYRLSRGQVPHVDFQTPLGGLTYLAMYAGLVLSGNYGAILPVATVLAMLAVAPALVYVLATRLSVLPASLLAAYLVLLIAAPLYVGDPLTQISWAMWYNRICWALIILLFLLYLPRGDGQHRSIVLEGLIAGFCVAALLYFKITFGLVAVAFLGVWFVLDPTHRGGVLIAAGVVVVTGLVVEALWGLHAAYLHDVLFAIEAGKGVTAKFFRPLKGLPYIVDHLVLVALATLLLILSARLTVRDGLFLAFVIVASLYISSQNSDERAVPALVVPLIVALARVRSIRPTDIDRHGHTAEARYAGYAVLGALVVFVAPSMVYQSLALVQHAVAAEAAVGASTVNERLGGFSVGGFQYWKVNALNVPVAELVEARDPSPERAFAILRDRDRQGGKYRLGPQEYIFTIERGIEDLKTLNIENKSVFVFDQANPFLFIMDLPPDYGGLFVYHSPRQYTRNAYISAEKVFDDIQIAMVPRFPIHLADRDLLMELYGDHLRRHFEVVRQSDYWTIWQRTP